MRLSVIVPGYRTTATQWIRCLDSILRNLSADDEVICIDDASPEEPTVVRDMAVRDRRLRYVRLSVNRGQAHARNRGIDLASGKYVAFVDSDDEVLDGIYGESIREMERNGADIAVYGVRVIWPDNGQFVDRPAVLDGVGRLNVRRLDSLLRNRVFTFPWNKVFRRAFLDRHDLRFVERAIPREDEVFCVTCVRVGAVWCAIARLGHIYYHGYDTSLARYRRYEEEANRAVDVAWKDLWTAWGCPKEMNWCAVDDEEKRLNAAWQNLWRRESPYGIVAKWRWLGERQVRGRTFLFARTAVRMFLRRHCYWRFVRRLLLRHQYPQAQDWPPANREGQL